MQKLKPKGIPDKHISIRLTLAERSRYKAFCKALGMDYSECFRAMSNDFILRKAKTFGLDIKCLEPSLYNSSTDTPAKDKQISLFDS